MRPVFESELASGGQGAQESWNRWQLWAAAGHENGWPQCGRRCAHFMRRRWDHRGVGSAITLRKPSAHADGVPAGPHEVAYTPGNSQSDADETESGTLVEPANRGVDSPSTGRHRRHRRPRIPRGHQSARRPPRPRQYFSTESVDCHTVGDCQRVADSQPIAVLICGRRICRNKRGFLALVGAGGLIACSRDRDSPSRAGTQATSLDG